jgi:hypothetical protein
MHRDGGANCFIFNDLDFLWTITPSSLSIRQLDGSHITAEGSGVVIIRPPGAHPLLALWPSYYYPSAPHHAFSPNAINNYLLFTSVHEEHTSHLRITVYTIIQLNFRSLPTELHSTGLDLFRAEVVLPTLALSAPNTVTLHPRAAYSRAPLMTRALIHQRFGHISDDVIDMMCREQTTMGLNKALPPRYRYDCLVCRLGKLPQFRKVKMESTAKLRLG